MPQASRTFRIFVSSTFSDLVAERNALQEHVFPRLRDLCQQHGARFQAIDLRWGVSEEAGLDQQTMKICLGEIARCQKVSPRPNFIVLLGDRDIDPNHWDLRRTPAANAQGEHRYARGHAFFEQGNRMAAQLDVAFGWELHTAPGVAHSNAGMAPYAAPFVGVRD